jgi:catechol 2,3-dioxygenase-like lactoylglutathione lyase family enzyme
MTHFEHQDLTQSQDLKRSGVSRIDRIGLTVETLKAAINFYVEALGFRTVGVETREGEAFAALIGLDRACATVATLRLGDETLELVQFTAPGRPYPEPRAANDPWFQHFALAVSDMDRAFAELWRFAPTPISRGGPQRLPPSTGDVTAYKFRDPDGHPLELSHAPKSAWADLVRQPKDRATLGIDHSALAVADLEASVRFYTEGLGLRLGDSSLNHGPEQARLDGLDDPVVDIATLMTRDRGPHLELLHYQRPKPLSPTRRFNINDIAASRVVMQTDDLDEVAERALSAGGARAAPAIVETATARRFLLRDPDGHLVELFDRND